jgi:hypothetical protein
MSLHEAYDLMQERMSAVGATSEGTLLERDVERLMFSGLPDDSADIGQLVQQLAEEAVGYIVQGVPVGPAVKGTLARALLVGYFLAAGGEA